MPLGAIEIFGSELNAFHVAGAVLAVWAVVVAGIGIRAGEFARRKITERIVVGISCVLVLGAILTGVLTAASEEAHEPGEGEPHAVDER